MGKNNRKNKQKNKINIQLQNNISVKEIENAIINANNKIANDNKSEMNGIILWTKEVLYILVIILILLFISFVIAFGKPIYNNIVNGKIFEPINIFLGCYVITGIFFVKHIFKISKEIEKINDISTITNIASLLLSIIALIVAIISLIE